MRLLLDSNVLIWFLAEPQRLSRSVFADIENPDNEVMFSAASIWELAVKSGKKPGSLPLDAHEVLAIALQTGFRELPVTAAVAQHVTNLPPHHGDPFDRLLIAQAMAERALFYTADAQLEAYSDLVRLI